MEFSTWKASTPADARILIFGDFTARGMEGSALLDGCDVVYRIIDDFTSHQLGWDMDDALADTRPDHVVLMTGVLDAVLEVPIDRLAGNFTALSEAVAKAGAHPVFILPGVTAHEDPRVQQRILSIRERMASAVGSHGSLVLNAPGQSVSLFDAALVASHRLERIHKQHDQAAAKTLMLGDSLTENGGNWNGRLSREDVLNAGQGGYTTGQIAWLLDPCLDRNSIEKVFFSAGINDLSLGIDPHVVFTNVVSIAKRLRDRGVELVIQSTILQENDVAVNRIIRDLNKKLEAFCENHHLAFLDLNANLAGDSGLKAEFTTDGTHLTEAGYAVWADTLLHSGLLDTTVPLDKLTLPNSAGNQ